MSILIIISNLGTQQNNNCKRIRVENEWAYNIVLSEYQDPAKDKSEYLTKQEFKLTNKDEKLLKYLTTNSKDWLFKV